MSEFFVNQDGSFTLSTTTREEADILTRARIQFGDEEIRDIIESQVSTWKEQFRALDAIERYRIYEKASPQKQAESDAAIDFVKEK